MYISLLCLWEYILFFMFFIVLSAAEYSNIKANSYLELLGWYFIPFVFLFCIFEKSFPRKIKIKHDMFLSWMILYLLEFSIFMTSYCTCFYFPVLPFAIITIVLVYRWRSKGTVDKYIFLFFLCFLPTIHPMVVYDVDVVYVEYGGIKPWGYSVSSLFFTKPVTPSHDIVDLFISCKSCSETSSKASLSKSFTFK